MLYFEGASAKERLAQFLKEAFQTAADVPFSFTYNGSASQTFLKDWKYEAAKNGISFLSPDGLKAAVEVQTFADFPAVEWLLTFENTSDAESGRIEDVCAMDIAVQASPFRTAGTLQFGALDNILYYNGGSDCKADDFIPCQEILHSLTARREMEFTCVEGRPCSGSHGAFPYFNLKTMDKGVFFAIGWSGQWKMKMTVDRSDVENSGILFRFKGGMDGVSTVLYPGEKIRTARILLMPWDGELEDANNQSRRFMLKYHTPHINGKPAVLPMSMSVWGTNARQHKEEIDLWAKSGIPLDTYWIDAGWYGPEGTQCDNSLTNDWSYHVGWYDPDPSRYPNGMGEVGQYAHDHGLRFLLWVEPDRATVPSPSYQAHPEYYLDHPYAEDSRMLNLGKEEAYQWALEMLSDRINTYHMDVLRIDYNVGPLAAWRKNDTENRRGMTEIRAVENFYRLWGELRRRFPHLIIDNCASGGRRLDFEANTYGVPLHRTDYLCYADSNEAGMQVQTAGLAPFVPLSGMGLTNLNWYGFISCLSAGKAISPELIARVQENPEERQMLCRMFEALKRVRPLYVGDFYLFTSVTLNEQDWFAYQMNRPEDGTACVVSARRSRCAMTGACYRLRGLERDASYLLEDAETGNLLGKKTGAQLMEEGLAVSLPQPASASLIFVTKE